MLKKNTNMRFFSGSPLPQRLKASFICSAEERKRFKDSRCQLTISVGQPMHEAERMSSTLELINSSFKSCTIMLDDSIQWHTNAIAQPKKAPQELLKEAIIAGDEWLARNKPLYEKLAIPYEIVRWRDWVGTQGWKQSIEEMQVAYEKHGDIRKAIDENVATFLERYEKNHDLTGYDRQRAERLCTDYLIEECGVMQKLWVSLNCGYEVYPSGRNQAMAATYAALVAPTMPHLLVSVGVRFHRKNIEKEKHAQKFQLAETLLPTQGVPKPMPMGGVVS